MCERRYLAAARHRWCLGPRWPPPFRAFDQPFANSLLSRFLARSAHCLRQFPGAFLRWFLIESPKLCLAKDAFFLKPLFQDTESLVDVVVAYLYLQIFSYLCARFTRRASGEAPPGAPVGTPITMNARLHVERRIARQDHDPAAAKVRRANDAWGITFWFVDEDEKARWRTGGLERSSIAVNLCLAYPGQFRGPRDGGLRSGGQT